MSDFDANKVMANAADDGDRPLDYSIDQLIRRGRRRVLIRQSAAVSASVLTVGALLVGVTQVAGGAGSDQPPVAGGQTEPTSIAVVPAPKVATMADAEIIRRCKKLDNDAGRPESNKAGGGTDYIDNWSVVIKQAPQRWVNALLLSPDGKRHAFCTIDTKGKYREEYNREAVSKPDYEVFTGGINGATDALPPNVARLTFETPDGVVSEARIKDGFFLWFNGRPYSDKPVWATFYDAAGKQLARFNARPPSKPLTAHS